MSDCIVLTDGITGGYVPAHVRMRILVYQRGREFFVQVMRQKTRSSKKTFKTGKLKKSEFRGLLALAEKVDWWKLSPESPKNFEDIYKLDASIGLRIGHCRSMKPAQDCVERLRYPTNRQSTSNRLQSSLVQVAVDRIDCCYLRRNVAKNRPGKQRVLS